MPHIPQGMQSAPLDQFLGLVTNIGPESIPEGGSPLCFDVDFITGSVFTRAGLVSVYTFIPSTLAAILQEDTNFILLEHKSSAVLLLE